MRDKRDLACNNGGKAMVHNVDVEAQKIGYVAGHIERHDLALAIREIFIATDATRWLMPHCFASGLSTSALAM
jgi:hypothetical protein